MKWNLDSGPEGRGSDKEAMRKAWGGIFNRRKSITPLACLIVASLNLREKERK